MVQQKKISAKLFIEGIEVPAGNVVVNINGNSMSSLSASMPYATKITSLQERSLVSLFYYDHYSNAEDEIDKYKLLFEGELQMPQVSWDSSSMHAEISALSLDNHWYAIYNMVVQVAVGGEGRTTPDSEGFDERPWNYLFGSGVMSGYTIDSQASAGLYTSVPVLNPGENEVALSEHNPEMLEVEYENLLNFWTRMYEANEYWEEMGEKYKLSSDSSYEFFTGNILQNLLQKKDIMKNFFDAHFQDFKGRSSLVPIVMFLSRIMSMFFLEYYINNCRPDKKMYIGLRAENIIPPACNVIFPGQYSNFSPPSRPLNTPTRIIGRSVNFGTETPMSLPGLNVSSASQPAGAPGGGFTGTNLSEGLRDGNGQLSYNFDANAKIIYLYPPEVLEVVNSILKGGDSGQGQAIDVEVLGGAQAAAGKMKSGSSKIVNPITEEEKIKGVITTQYNMDDAVMGLYKELMKESSGGSNDLQIVTDILKYFTISYFYQETFLTQNYTMNLDFCPRLAAGFPAVIIRHQSQQIAKNTLCGYGKIISLTHIINNQSGSCGTVVNISNGRNIDQDDKIPKPVWFASEPGGIEGAMESFLGCGSLASASQSLMKTGSASSNAQLALAETAKLAAGIRDQYYSSDIEGRINLMNRKEFQRKHSTIKEYASYYGAEYDGKSMVGGRLESERQSAAKEYVKSVFEENKTSER